MSSRPEVQCAACGTRRKLLPPRHQAAREPCICGKTLCVDPLYGYRQLDGLIVIGPAELDKACRGLDASNNPNLNPLDLEDYWIPDVPVPAGWDEWLRSAKWRTDSDWKTRAAVVLTPPEIGGISTSLVGQFRLWGAEHRANKADPGLVRQDVLLSSWLKPDYDWVNEPAVPNWQWMLVYEHPRWTTGMSWDDQQSAAAKKGMSISTAAQDAFALNVILAATGTRLRLEIYPREIYSRTSTLYNEDDKRYPLSTYTCERGVVLRRNLPPEAAHGYVAASVQGVPAPE